MLGNVYVKFGDEDDAEGARSSLAGRYYAGRQLTCEFCPVTDFREARCRQFDEGSCARGGFCNFMHVREPSRELRKHLERVFKLYYLMLFLIRLFTLILQEYGFKGGEMIGTGSMATLGGGGGGRGGSR